MRKTEWRRPWRIGDDREQPVEGPETRAVRKLGLGFCGEEGEEIAGERVEGLDATVGLNRDGGQASMRGRVPAPAGDECGKDGSESKGGKEPGEPIG